MKKIALNVAGFFVAIVAVLFNLPTLYLMAAILWLIPAVSYAMGRLMLVGLFCERQEPSACQVGQRIQISLLLTNLGWLPKFFLLARDGLPPGVRAIGGDAPLILHLGPGQSGKTIFTIEPERRGIFRLGPVQVFSTDPLGLHTFSQKLRGTSELIVYPAIIPADTSWLTGGVAQGWRGQENAQARGSGTDFYGVRDYQPGDELRRVHWRTTARTGSLAVTEYTQGLALDAVIALDLNAKAYRGTGEDANGALETAVTLAASLLDDLLRHGHSARLLTANDPEGNIGPGREQMPQVLEALARAEANSAWTLADVLAKDGTRAGRETSLIYITPEAQDPRLLAMLAEWKSRGAQSFGFALDPDSYRRPFSNQTGSRGIVTDAAIFPHALRIVRRGDDLRQAIGGSSDA